MNVNEDSMLLNISPAILITILSLFVIIAYYSAYKYRDTNDFSKAIKLQVVLIILVSIIAIILKMPIVLITMMIICSIVCGAIFSNYFFYK